MLQSMPVKMVEYTLWDMKEDIFLFFIFTPPKYSTLSIGILQIISLFILYFVSSIIVFSIADLFVVRVTEFIYHIFSKLLPRLIGCGFLVLFSIAMSIIYGWLIKESFRLSFVYVSLLSTIHFPIFVALSAVLKTDSSKFILNITFLFIQGLISQYLMNKSILANKTSDMRLRKLFAYTILCIIFSGFYFFEFKYLIK